MNVIVAIALREFKAFFRTPAGWVVSALFSLLCAIVFLTGFLPGEPATMRSFFVLAGWLSLLIAPAISMRLIAEEYRTGALETLSTAPISDWQVAIGKFLGGSACFVAMSLPTFVFVAALAGTANPDYGPIIGGYIGLWLLGVALIAIGLFFSTVTRNQVAALLSTVFFVILTQVAATIVARAADGAIGAWLSAPLYTLSLAPRMDDFAKGVIDTKHVAFFLAAAIWFTSMSAIVMEARRWR